VHVDAFAGRSIADNREQITAAGIALHFQLASLSYFAPGAQRKVFLDADLGNVVVRLQGVDTAAGGFQVDAAGGLDSPFDVLPAAGELQVAGITSDAIRTYQLNGTYIDDFAAVDNFPEQIAVSAPGGFLVGNFSGSQEGVIEFDAAGGVIGVYDPPSLGGYRGAYELPNGNILTTNGGGVHEIDRSGNLVETKIDGVSARFIELVVAGEDVVLPPPPAVPALSGLSLLLLALLVAAVGWFVVKRREISA